MLQEEANAAAASSAAASAVAPSAPVALDLPSAPPLAPVETYQSNECVVCLENKVRLFPLILISNTLCSVFFLCVSTVQHHLSSLRACLCMLEMRSWADPLSSLPDSNRPKGAAQLADLSTGDVNNVFLLFTLFHDHVICHQ